ncbi:hypothetical protein O1611_g7385 [Lasiodiplodia mahajangana]|uniref:Uncharacterized protein n=1 Tax=Lasiodiplodia mahajangana TaxID=1108764 RepID=A0ACC2JGA2_9PEZI|nr:hypothetical protein O1611_g7385 [Lasiodiplodia mahajangana]
MATEWDSSSLLSFDGGGIRGYASLCILEELMNRIGVIEGDPEKLQNLFEREPRERQPETSEAQSSFHPHISPFQQQLDIPFLPCHYFDYIIGASTGGLIAIMLGRFRMSVDQAKAQYEQLGNTVFGFPRIFHYRSPLFATRCKFSAKRLATAVNVVANKHGGGRVAETLHQGISFKSDPDLCKTLVVAHVEVYGQSTGPSKVMDSAHIFRPYDLTAAGGPMARNPGYACELPVQVVARATTAAPTYFKPEEIKVPGGETWRFKDGGMRANNPTEEGKREVEYRAGKKPDFVVSIGTCSRNGPLFTGHPRGGGLRDTLNVVWDAIRRLTDPVRIHESMYNDYRKVIPGYFRFDDQTSDEWKDIKMDDWKGDRQNGPGSKTLNQIKALVNDYARDNEDIINRCAEQLVRRRRLRALNEGMWERNRDDLKQHLKTHPVDVECFEEQRWAWA